MPSTGVPSSNTAGGAPGGAWPVTDSGPPDRMMPRAPNERTSAALTSPGCISQYTPSSRTRRAISCVYCAPKSMIRIRCAWISAGGATGSSAATDSSSGRAVIGRLLRDRHVMHVALAHAGVGDAHEPRSGSHFLDVVAAGIAHGGTQSAGELVQDRDQAALVGDATLDTLRHQLLELGGG